MLLRWIGKGERGSLRMLCEEETISQCRVGVADKSRGKGAS